MTVTAWRVALEARGLGPISINVRITALRKLAVEAADNGLLAPELASGIPRIKGVKSHGARVGNWLSLRQAQALLNAPDVRTKKGLRDRAMFATLLGCGFTPVGAREPDREARPAARQPMVNRGSGRGARAGADDPDAVKLLSVRAQDGWQTNCSNRRRESSVMSLFAWIVLGLLAGFISSHLVNHRGEGMVLDVLLGIVGAVTGGWVAHLLGYAAVTRLDLYGVIVATVGAMIFLFVYHAIRRGVIGRRIL